LAHLVQFKRMFMSCPGNFGGSWAPEFPWLRKWK